MPETIHHVPGLIRLSHKFVNIICNNFKTLRKITSSINAVTKGTTKTNNN